MPNAWWSLVNGIASLSYPYRLAQELHDGTTLQQSDSIPFLHDRPLTRKSAAGQAYQAAKQAALGPNDQRMLADSLGLYPKPDDRGVIALTSSLPRQRRTAAICSAAACRQAAT